MKEFALMVRQYYDFALDAEVSIFWARGPCGVKHIRRVVVPQFKLQKVPYFSYIPITNEFNRDLHAYYFIGDM